jgi:RimJ/RimL family protein N-acetyltransferase
MSQRPDSVHLVRMAAEHLATTYHWLRDSAELRQQVDCIAPPTEQGNRAHWRSKWQEAAREDYAIITAEGRHVGNCGLCDIDPLRRKAQLWIYLGETHGTGGGTDAVWLLLERTFGELRLNRLFVRVVADNLRALAFYRRLGFVEEGLARQDTVRGDQYIDCVLMALLADDYAAARDSTNGGS